MKVKDFVELVISKIPYMPIVDNSAKYADLTKKENTNTLSAEPSHSFGPDFSYIMNNKITIPR